MFILTTQLPFSAKSNFCFPSVKKKSKREREYSSWWNQTQISSKQLSVLKLL